MLIENFLTFYMRRISRRYLSLKKNYFPVSPKPGKNKSYLLYIHIPFCEKLCPYCSFYKIPFDRELASLYFENLKREIELYQNLGFNFESIYVGGGTPTVMPNELAEVIQFIQKRWTINQVSVETNPNHITNEIIQVLKDTGVNRLSVGVQSFNDNLLSEIDRLQKYGSGNEIKDKLSSIKGIFDTLNVDMIFNFPNQTLSMLLKDIEIIKEIKADQVTFYPLMVSNTTQNSLQSLYGKINYSQEKEFYQRIVTELSDIYSPATAWCFTCKKRND